MKTKIITLSARHLILPPQFIGFYFYRQSHCFLNPLILGSYPISPYALFNTCVLFHLMMHINHYFNLKILKRVERMYIAARDTRLLLTRHRILELCDFSALVDDPLPLEANITCVLNLDGVLGILYNRIADIHRPAVADVL